MPTTYIFDIGNVTLSCNRIRRNEVKVLMARGVPRILPGGSTFLADLPPPPQDLDPDPQQDFELDPAPDPH